MCVIAVSKKGIQQPTTKELHDMWNHNPDGSGYMVARNGKVEIHKGFMFWDDFIRSVRSEKFTADDSVIYHFRISTQAGIRPEMTHPFPLTRNRKVLKALDVLCDIGIAHNGIIPMTTDINNRSYSDTAIFIEKYMSYLIRSIPDMHNRSILEMIEELAKSKFAIMDKNGEIETVGKFYNHNGILLSNENHMFDWSKYYLKDGGYKSVLYI